MSDNAPVNDERDPVKEAFWWVAVVASALIGAGGLVFGAVTAVASNGARAEIQQVVDDQREQLHQLRAETEQATSDAEDAEQEVEELEQRLLDNSGFLGTES